MKKNGKLFTIGVLIGNVHSPYTTQLLQGMSEAAKTETVNTVCFLATHSGYLMESVIGQGMGANYDYQFNTIYDYANLGGLDALIISYGSLCDFLEESDKYNKDLFIERFKGIPYLLLEDEDRGENANYMIADNYVGMYQVVEHLVRDHGYTRMVYVSGPQGNKDALERMTAFLDVCKKYGVTVPDDAIAYGNFTETAYIQIKDLLARYPDSQAVVCANDEMAYAGYRACGEMGMRVGKDIAITGFDNNSKAEIMDPPITTVEFNSFNAGYAALLKALKLCAGEQAGGTRIPTSLKIRESCGCAKNADVHYGSAIRQDSIQTDRELIKQIADEIIKTKMNKDIYDMCLSYSERLVSQILSLSENAVSENIVSNVINIIDEMAHGVLEKYIYAVRLMNAITLLFSITCDRAENPQHKLEIMKILTAIQKKRQAFHFYAKEVDTNKYNIRSWFVQMIAREMTENLDVEEEFFLRAIGKLKLLNIKSSYIYLMDDVHVHHAGEQWHCPDRLRLAAYHSGENAVSYEREKRPVVSAECGLSEYLTDQDGCRLSAFILYSDERQYGLLLCEIDPNDISLAYFTSLQIGTALRFLEMRKTEMDIRGQLEESLNTIKTKNEVLNFISEYDELTGLLNRRGFMERAMTVNQNSRYTGRKAAFIFADLDHLKEINDRFGHGEGDFAIKKAADILKDTFHQSIWGRIGGDEFVSFIMEGNYSSAEDIKRSIKKSFNTYNRSSCKPYYIESSIGCIEFICGHDQHLSDIIKLADECLYNDKRLRKETISKITEE